LKIAAKVDPVDQDYYEQIIKPLLDPPLIEYVGEISDQEKSEFLCGAIALLVTIDWSEPFGLVMIEAMACGTPVVAFNRGSVPEIVEDDVTGYIVEDELSAANAVKIKEGRQLAASVFYFVTACLATHCLEGKSRPSRRATGLH